MDSPMTIRSEPLAAQNFNSYNGNPTTVVPVALSSIAVASTVDPTVRLDQQPGIVTLAGLAGGASELRRAPGSARLPHRDGGQVAYWNEFADH